MTGIGFAVTTPELVVRRAALAVRPVELSTGAPVGGRLRVVAWPEDDPRTRVDASTQASSSGVFGFPVLPGLGRYEDGSTPRAGWFASPLVGSPRRFVVRVEDRSGDYLTSVVAVMAPAPAVVTVPLGSSAGRLLPAGAGIVIGQAIDTTTGGGAAWALVRVHVGTVVAGALCDALGRFVTSVPLASPPTSPGTPAAGPTWTATISVRYRPADQQHASGVASDGPPLFASIAAQAAALLDDGGAPMPQLDRTLTTSGPLVVWSAPPPAPSVLLVHPS